MAETATALLITLTGRDRPGVTARVCAALAEHGAEVADIEQVVIRERLILGFLVTCPGPQDGLREAVSTAAAALGVHVEFEPTGAPGAAIGRAARHTVTVLGQPLTPAALGGVAGAIADCGANIDRIVRLSRYPVLSFELAVSGGEAGELRRRLAAAAVTQRVDVAVQRADLFRRAKRLVCMDVDSTLVDGEVIDLLAAHSPAEAQVAAITAAAMAGELDFEHALRRRVALLEGLPAEVVGHVREHLVLTRGARTLVRTLKRLGFTLAIVSGGFTLITDHLKAELGLDYAMANELEVVDGRLTGRLVGPIVDRAGKADALERFAADAGVPLSQTVAIGDGANDLDMLGRAGLGIAFNAKPLVREAADTAVSVPYLDAILFLLGIPREEVEAADADDPDFVVLPQPPLLA